MWYNGGVRWFNLNTGIIILVIIIILFAIGMGVVGFSLWNVPKAKEIFTFLEISDVFPTKEIALFTGLATFGTLILALATVLTIKTNNEREKRNRRERILNEIIKWVLNVKLSTVHGMAQVNMVVERQQKYGQIFIAISDALLDAELMALRASENSIPVEKELNNVWHSAFFCSQLAARINGNKPTDEQRKRWIKNALDIVVRIDQLEEQGNLTDKEMYDGQRDLLEKISLCLKKLVEVEATSQR